MVKAKELICMYTPSAVGGHALYTMEILSALAKRDGRYRFELVTSEDLGPQYHTSAYPITRILPPLKHRKSFATPAHWMLSRATHYQRRERLFVKWLRGRADVAGVHFQEIAPWLSAGVYRNVHRMGKKVFYTVHNVVPHRCPKYIPRRQMLRWVREGYRQCDGLFVHTDALAKELERFIGGAHPPIQVAPHGVWSIAGNAAIPSMKERLAWKKLLFFGSIRRNKGLDLLLAASRLMPQYSITIAGWAGEPDYFHSEVVPQVNQLKAEGRQIDLQAKFFPDDELPGLFASHSAIMLPYTQNFMAQSGVVFMAMAHEVPVVASEAGGLADLLGKYRIGVTFRRHTPEALANAVEALMMESPDSLQRQIQQAKQFNSWQRAAEATMDGYALAARESTKDYGCAIPTTATH